MTTIESLLSVPDVDGIAVLDDTNLTNSAARAAAIVLAPSWIAGLADGTPLDVLLADVDGVINILTTWRHALHVREHVCAPELRTDLAGLRGMLDDASIASTWGPALRRVFAQVKV